MSARTQASQAGRGAASWLKGAEGEEYVGGLLAPLRLQGWSIRHDLPLGPNWNIDHVAIGPSGVFAIDTKNVSGEIRVLGARIERNGIQEPYTDTLQAAVQEVRDRLMRATGRRTLWVQGVLAFTHAELSVEAFPQNVLIVRAANIVSALQNQPPRLDREEATELAHAARDPATWS